MRKQVGSIILRMMLLVGCTTSPKQVVPTSTPSPTPEISAVLEPYEDYHKTKEAQRNIKDGTPMEESYVRWLNQVRDIYIRDKEMPYDEPSHYDFSSYRQGEAFQYQQQIIEVVVTRDLQKTRYDPSDWYDISYRPQELGQLPPLNTFGV